MVNIIKGAKAPQPLGTRGSAIPLGTIFTSDGPSAATGVVNEYPDKIYFKGPNGYVYNLKEPSRIWWDNGNDLYWSNYRPVSVTIEVNKEGQ